MTMDDEGLRRSLADKLRTTREYLGVSQEEVAKALNISRSAISLIESGRRKVDAIELQSFARVYQCSVAELTGEIPTNDLTQSLDVLKRTASELTEGDREEVLRFAEYLRARARVKFIAGPKK
mgnify:CR=1 FL=1